MEELKHLTNELSQFCANNKVDKAKVGLLMGLFMKHTKAMEQVKNTVDLGSVGKCSCDVHDDDRGVSEWRSRKCHDCNLIFC